MVNKDEWQEWKMSAVTTKVLELIKVGIEQTVEDLLAQRGQVADFQRGAWVAYEEVANIIRTGEGLIEE
jgi:hypothetical protein